MSLQMVAKPEEQSVILSRQAWAQKINSRWQDSAQAILDVGAMLVESRHALKHGEFGEMIEKDLPFGARTAQMLMKTAEHPVLPNAKHVSHLPPSWGTLYELSKVPPHILEQALEDGRVHPEMERREVRDLLPKDSPVSPEAETCEVKDLERLVSAGKKFSTIYADPPWQYSNQGTRAATDNHYVTMTPQEIAALPIKQLASDNAHLHLWTTNAFLFESRAIMEAWGFEYKSMLVWVKPQMGIGNYWRVSHEFLLLGVRGQCPFLNRGQKSWIETDRLEHSTKPEIFRRTIELVSPPPRLELFGRRLADGWAVWGNEIERTMFDVKVEVFTHEQRI